MINLSLPLYCAGIALLIVLIVTLLTIEHLHSRLALGLIMGTIATAIFLVDLGHYRSAIGRQTPAPGMASPDARASHPWPNPSEIKIGPKIFKNKKLNKKFFAPYGTKLLRATRNGQLMTAIDIRAYHPTSAALVDSCRDADHALECACVPEDQCTNAPAR